ncbi:MAG TPA: SigE family RNA polymerase sigma factor [Streptosporangiaceae bacterium]|nr:SigE family RNA polymerase sigma factor [Streptosporangiaceae bacterium]
MRVGGDRQPGRLGTRPAGKSTSAAQPPKPRPPATAEELTETVDLEFNEFVVSRGRALLHSAYLLTGNLADAEDLVQSALAKTYQAWDRIEDRNALDGYVRRAMVNTHISWWRRRKVDEYPTDDLPDTPVADATANSETNDALRRAIDRLPQRMRAAVVLRFFEDMTEAEVADVLGVSQGTVKSTVSRAVAKLRTDSELFTELTCPEGRGAAWTDEPVFGEEGRRRLRRPSMRGSGGRPPGRCSSLASENSP